MGSTTSKAARTAAAASGAAKRQYPQRIPSNLPPALPPPPQPAASPQGPTVHPKTSASSTRDEAINRDAADPDFARSLRFLGPVTPSPTLSNSSSFNSAQRMNPSSSSSSSSSSTAYSPQHQQQIFPSPSTNPAIRVLTARAALTEAAEAEFAKVGRKGFSGRRFLDVVTIRQILVMRDEKGVGNGEIERTLGLEDGTVRRLGGKGVVADVGLELGER